MTELKYTVIKSTRQYNRYCNLVEEILSKQQQTLNDEAEVELLTVLIEVWDQKHSTTKEFDPIQLLVSLIQDHKLKPTQMMTIMGISGRGHYYEILNYRKGLSKDVIRRIAKYFKVSQEAFNRAYTLKTNLPEIAPKNPTLQGSAKRSVA